MDTQQTRATSGRPNSGALLARAEKNEMAKLRAETKKLAALVVAQEEVRSCLLWAGASASVRTAAASHNGLLIWPSAAAQLGTEVGQKLPPERQFCCQAPAIHN